MNVHNRSTLPALAGAAALLLLLGTACSDDRTPVAASGQAGAGEAISGEAASTDPQGLSITFRTLDSPIAGDNKVEAVVKNADGTPVTDATVSVTFRMPAMPTMNMPEMHSTTPLVHEADGRYVGTGQLEMTGSWNVTVSVARNGAPIGSQRFSLLAK